MKLSDRLNNISNKRKKQILDDLQNERHEELERDPSKPPKSPLDLIRNLKAVFDDGSVLNENFFSDESLKSISGAHSINRATTKVFLTVGDIVNPVMVGSFLHCGIQYNFSKWNKDNNLFIGADISFLEMQPILSFSSMVCLFGCDWEDADDKIPPPSRVFKPTSHPMGNRTIKFVLHTERGTRVSTLDLNPDGTLQGLSILQESK